MALIGTAPALLASTTTTTPDISVGHLLLQMILAIGVVGGGIWLFGKYVQRRRTGLSGVGRSAMRGLSVLSRTSLGKDHLIAVVAWGDPELLVGVAGSTITLLADGERGTEGGAEVTGDTSLSDLLERPAVRTGRTTTTVRPSFLEALRTATLRG